MVAAQPHGEKTHIPKTAAAGGRGHCSRPSPQLPDSRSPAAPPGTVAALLSSSVTDGAGWVEASESSSFHTYLMLVTAAETLHRVIELMRYLRKCIFFFTKKKNPRDEGGGTFDGVFSHKEIIFFSLQGEAGFFGGFDFIYLISRRAT